MRAQRKNELPTACYCWEYLRCLPHQLLKWRRTTRRVLSHAPSAKPACLGLCAASADRIRNRVPVVSHVTVPVPRRRGVANQLPLEVQGLPVTCYTWPPVKSCLNPFFHLSMS
jgi:hypothetical protein